MPRIGLAHLPTPLESSPGLSRLLGIDLHIKRDDLTGLAFGGNKTRNLEFRLPEVLDQGLDTVVLSVQATSNSARQTVAAANRLSLRSVLYLRGGPTDEQGNLRIDRLLGAEIHFVSDNDAVVNAALEEYCAAAREQGHRPWVLNWSPMFEMASTIAYMECSLEVQSQLAAGGKSAQRIYMTSGGKGQAGLELARSALGDRTAIVGVAVSNPRHDRRMGIADLARRTADFLKLDVNIDAGTIENNRGHVGLGYGQPGEDTIEAIHLAARLDGLLLDPVYTGKGMAALIADVRTGRIPPGETVVFIHTGGQPALFSGPPLRPPSEGSLP